MSSLTSAIRAESHLKPRRNARDLISQIPQGHPILGRIEMFRRNGIDINAVPENHPLMIELAQLAETAAAAERSSERAMVDRPVVELLPAKKNSAKSLTKPKVDGIRRSRRIEHEAADFRRQQDELYEQRKMAIRSVEDSLSTIVNSIDKSFAAISSSKESFVESPAASMALKRIESVVLAARKSFVEHMAMVRRLEDKR